MPTQSPPAPARGHDSRVKLLDAAVRLIRAKGYGATRVEDICAEAGLTKGAFFHHWKSKEELAVAAAEHWSETTGRFFASADYRKAKDPLARVLGYIDFRRALLRGAPPEFTCLVGTMVQEVHQTSPSIRDACERSIRGHADEVARDIALAKKLYAPRARWSAEGLALYTQAVLQGAFVLAKARDGTAVAEECVDHLKRYFEMLFDQTKKRSS